MATRKNKTIMRIRRAYRHPCKRKRHDVCSRKSFKCSKCEAMFVEKSNLNKLIQVMHDGRKFACEKCDTKFANGTPEPRTGKLEKVLYIFLYICLHYARVSSARPPHIQRKGAPSSESARGKAYEAPDRPARRRVSAMLIFLAPCWG